MAPIIELIEGIKIVVFSREHLPPHIHAKFGEYEVLINIQNGVIEEGKFPKNKLNIVKKWLEIEENKKLAEKNFYELNPKLNTKNSNEKEV
ncbi:MAG: DUF4160 domain-containing protein [Crocinitomicaceae bacterium]|nr:DUF4160 domain-containing protein [Crocinitomicaceae bacterium]